MVPQTCLTALTGLVAVGVITCATAQELKPGGDQNQITNAIGMKLTLVPSGEFIMGSSEPAARTAGFFIKHYHMDESMAVLTDVFKNEHPQRRTQISKPFYLGTYHVTRGQFRQFVKDSAYKTDAETGRYGKRGSMGWDEMEKKLVFDEKYTWQKVGFEQTDEHPVVCVSWNDAVAFCKWLSKKEGKTYGLPTEAESEYACRAGTTTRYYSGDDPETLANVANIADATARAKFPDWKCAIKASDGYVFTSPVGQFKPNAFGLRDMLGNAFQLCADIYARDLVTEAGDKHVIRGGSWGSCPAFARSASRSGIPQYEGRSNVGFRVARTE
jgi:formylglycine-generating enzyme required for sulfatase activity